MRGDAPVTGSASTVPSTILPRDWLAWLLREVPRTPVTTLPLTDVHGLVLAEDVHSPSPLPHWTNSAMDGYALRSDDSVGASAEHPVRLRVLGEIAAGSSEDPPIPRGAAVRIMTGAPLPSQADTVIAVEQTRGDRDDGWADREVMVTGTVEPGANVRRAGETLPRGGLLVEGGTRLTAARLAALVAAGVDETTVHRRPRVAVIVTGSELRAPGASLSRGQIPESNSAMIAGMLREIGIDPVSILHSPDDPRGLRQRVSHLSKQCDVVITTGGIGPGIHDTVRITLEREPLVRGARIAMRPGAPQRAGKLESGGFVFALPGNPVSAAVSFELFVRPTLLAMQGDTRPQRPRINAIVAEGWRGAAGRLQVLPVRVRETPDGLACVPTVEPRSVSHAVAGHGASDGYALVDERRGDVATGETVPVILVGI